MSLYIKESYTVKREDVISEISKHDGCIYAVYTDRLTCGDEVTDSRHLLEVRIFSEKKEVKLSAPSVSDNFICRIIDDDYFSEQLLSVEDDFEKVFENRILDDFQYLDVDSVKSRGRNYRSTGGGEYTLPYEKLKTIHIRNYIDYSENGIAEIRDFRIVELTEKGVDEYE